MKKLSNHEFMLERFDDHYYLYDYDLFDEQEKDIEDFKVIYLYWEGDGLNYFREYTIFNGDGDYLITVDDKKEVEKFILENSNYKKIILE